MQSRSTAKPSADCRRASAWLLRRAANAGNAGRQEEHALQRMRDLQETIPPFQAAADCRRRELGGTPMSSSLPSAATTLRTQPGLASQRATRAEVTLYPAAAR